MIAVPVGTWAASRKGGWADRAAAGATTALLSVPDLLLGLGLLLLAVRTGYFPTGGMVSLGFAELGPWDKVKDVVSHFLLPVTALTLVNLPVLVRHVRASLIDVLQAPFIQRGARGGNSRAAAAVSPRVACRREPLDFAAGALRRRRCSARRSSSKRS